jgi:hypothetical protein
LDRQQKPRGPFFEIDFFLRTTFFTFPIANAHREMGSHAVVDGRRPDIDDQAGALHPIQPPGGLDRKAAGF